MSESDSPTPASTPQEPAETTSAGTTAEPTAETTAETTADSTAETTAETAVVVGEESGGTEESPAPQAAAAESPAPQAPAADAPASGPRPGARPAPGPRGSGPRPRPAAPSPAVLAGKKPSAPLLPAAPPVTEYDAEQLAAAKEYGSVAEDGTVTVQDGTQVRTIGTADPAAEGDALEPYAKGYLDLVAFLDLTEKKLTAPEHTHNELNRLLENLRKNMKEPQVVGDIPALRQRAHDLREQAKSLIAGLEARRAEQRAAAVARRTAFVEEIETLVATPPEQISWRTAGETMRQMVPTWKQMQTEDVSLDRPTEDALWKRLSAARATFDRHRKQFFAQLDEKHEEAARTKERLIARAEEMQDSTDWGPTVRAYKDLMDQWRRAPRGSRKKDDAQWARFKAAQDTFFAARNADLEATESEQRENLAVKEALLQEAAAIDPAADLDAAKAALRSVQDRWEDAGKVPRGDLRRVEDRLRSIERSVKEAEEAEWRRTDPRHKARVQGASSQLQSAISGYEEALEKARASGDPQRIAEAEAALEARREWLAVIERSARELG